MLLECQLTHQVWKMTTSGWLNVVFSSVSMLTYQGLLSGKEPRMRFGKSNIEALRSIQTATTQQPEACSIHCWSYFINIPTISETHPDDLLTDSDVNIEGFSIFRTDINQFIGEVVISAHNHYPAKAHYDFMRDNTEAVFVQVHSARLKPASSCSYWWAISK